MILVFGKTGQVATELRQFEDVVCVGREDADLTDPQACADIILNLKPMAVINAAAYTAVDDAEDDEHNAFVVNASAPGAMASACAKLSIPIVHISTDYVFEGSGVNAWTTNDFPKPQNVYGRSKSLGERKVLQSGATYAILRTSWVVSAHGNNFVKTMLRLSKTMDVVRVVGDQVGGPTPARDIARACIEIAIQLQSNLKKSGIYHYSGFPDVSWCEFANEVFKLARVETRAQPISSVEYPTKAIRPLNSRLNNQTTAEVFGIARPNWAEGVKEIIKDLEV